jgi:3-oxoisoapionate decarboxylase
MMLDRREMLAALIATALAPAKRTRLGIASFSYHLRLAAERADKKKPGLADPLTFLEHCHQLGAGGVQLGLGVRDTAYIAKLRKQAEMLDMFLEGSIRLPQNRSDVERFTAEVRTTREAGANVLRTVLLSGRRYETFDTLAAFRKWAEGAWQSLSLAEPVVAKHDMRLAVENHKDWRAADLADLLKRLGSRHVGACIDTGNNIALLEYPLETVETLAPFAYSVHLKDMAVAEYEDGFLLSEVPLGEGFVDLKRIVAMLRKGRPGVRFSLEMITRDPLKVPCLTPKYWATFENLSGRHLAQTLAMVRKHKSPKPLPRVTGLSREEQIATEEDNIRKCLDFARTSLGL